MRDGAHLNSQPSVLNLTLNPQPSSLCPQASALNPQPSALNPHPPALTLNPQPSTLSSNLDPQQTKPQPPSQEEWRCVRGGAHVQITHIQT